MHHPRFPQVPEAEPAPILVLSPELALVDPELAAMARARLVDPAEMPNLVSAEKRTRPEFEPEGAFPGQPPPAGVPARRFRTGLRFRAATRGRGAGAGGRAITVGVLGAVAIGAGAQASAPVDVSARADAVAATTSVASRTEAPTRVPLEPRKPQGPGAATAPAAPAAPPALAPAHRPAPERKADDGIVGEGAGGRARPSRVAPKVSREAVAANAAEPDVAPPVLMWPPVSGAAAYRVELYRDGSRILARVTRPPRIALAASWRYEGLRRDLVPGRYEWIVYPLRRRGSVLVQTEAVIRSEWLLAR